MILSVALLRAKSALELTAFLVCAALLFRPLNREVLWSRTPFFLEAVGFLLIFGVGDLGFAFSALNGPLASVSATRIYLMALALMIVTGIPWAIVNLHLRRAVTFNVLALVAAGGWMVLFLLGLTGALVWYL